MSTVSIIIPCYNSESYVRRAVDSALKQTYKDCEILLIDNGSSDNTGNILADYQNKNPKKIKVLHESKKGAPAARNRGINESQGEWLQFLDSDDELLPNKIEHQVQITDGADLIIGNRYKRKQIGNKIIEWLEEAEIGKPWLGLIKSRLGNTSANLWNRKSVLAVNGWNEQQTSSQEYELMFRMLKSRAVVRFCSHPETIIYVRNDSIVRSPSESKTSEILQNKIKLRLQIRDYLKVNGLMTKELAREVDTYIFDRLMKYKDKAPEYVQKTISEVNLKIPLYYRLQYRMKRIESKLKKVLK
ncbi:MAG: glycosyltransferase family 2 protein, partial [Chitinophagaceae bacterium]|nr:glycosyltransferase family 2 protein [Chitinophagaceae bacterium]